MFPINTLEESMPALYGAQQVQKLYQQGLQSQYMPKTLQEQLRHAQLVNQYYGPNIESEMYNRNQQGNLYGQQAQWHGPNIQSEIALRGMEGKNLASQIAQRAYQQNNPLGQLSSMPELFKAQALYRHFVDTLGENDSRTQDAKKNYEIMQKNAQASGEYRGAMTQSAPQRFLSPTGKDILAAAQTSQGYYPSATGTPAGQPIPQPTQQSPNQGQPQQQQVSTLDSALSNPINTAQGIQGNAVLPETETVQNAFIRQRGENGGVKIIASNGVIGTVPANKVGVVLDSGGKLAEEIPQQQIPSISPALSNIPAGSTQQQAPSSSSTPPLTAPEMTGLLTGSAIKKAGTTQLLNRIHFMTLADNTFNNLLPDVPAMESYTGVEGRSRLAADKAQAAIGESSPKYQAYIRYKTNAAFLATQLRTAYGDSVQEEAAKKLTELTNPSAWDKDPAAAHEALMTFHKTFMQELEKSKQMLLNPLSIYREQKPKPIKSLEQANKIANGQEEKTLNGKRYVKINGEWHTK